MDIVFPWPQHWSWWIIAVWVNLVVLTVCFRWPQPELPPEPEPYRFIHAEDLPSCTVTVIREKNETIECF
jgi:hypothetical protein